MAEPIGVLVIRGLLEAVPEFVPLKKPPTLEQLQEWCGGHIQEAPGIPGCFIYCDEEGLLKGLPLVAIAHDGEGRLGHYLHGGGIVLMAAGGKRAPKKKLLELCGKHFVIQAGGRRA